MALTTLSLDWNCAIAVENSEPEKEQIERLVELHDRGQADVGVLQTSASENMTGSRAFPGSYSSFEARLTALGWAHLPRVPTPGVWGLSFWGHFKWVDENRYAALRDDLWKEMFPGISISHEDFASGKGLSRDTEICSPDLSNWRNAWCDVHSAYSHIEEQRDLFVTSNTKHFRRISGHGFRAVTPMEAVEELARRSAR